MKYLRVKIKREQNPNGGTHYVYPPEYDAKAVKFGPSYETFNPAKVSAVKARPVPHEFCVIAVDDADFDKFNASADIEEITEADFVFNGEDNFGEDQTFIEDEAVVLGILDKVSKGQPLTPKEKDAIDRDKPERGVGKAKRFAEVWAERKAELGIT